ncbi:unnamed protein product [Protopolystoma xenopodis]|uniref:IQCH-like ATP-grasp domain-containing protein n=1 Tax=Protopolystoma xenopodis TaxID=117903 RepID=A0A3S5CPT9_9PLAT|nr:unnamed protein product [Protopolystoma xenopodis]
MTSDTSSSSSCFMMCWCGALAYSATLGGAIEACPPAANFVGLTSEMVILPSGKVRMLVCGDHLHAGDQFSAWGLSGECLMSTEFIYHHFHNQSPLSAAYPSVSYSATFLLISLVLHICTIC